MTKNFRRHTVSSTQPLSGWQPTFTLNLEVYCLTALAAFELFRSEHNPPSGRRQHLRAGDLPGEDRVPCLDRGTKRHPSFKARASIDVGLVTDTTRTC